MNNIARLALTALALSLACVPAFAEGRVAGMILSIEGAPQIKSGTGGYKAAKLRQNVYEGDSVRTGRSERVSIVFMGGAEMRINQNSVFEIRGGGGAAGARGMSAASVFTRLGDAWTRMVNPGAHMEVHSPTAVAAVRGTEGDINVEAQTMMVKVYEGLIDVTNDKGKQTLKAGQMTTASAGQAPEAPRPMTTTDYGTWQNSVKPSQRSVELRTKDGKLLKFNLEEKKK